MSVLNSLASLDRYLASLHLCRDEHAVIQMHMAKMKQELEVELAGKT